MDLRGPETGGQRLQALSETLHAASIYLCLLLQKAFSFVPFFYSN